VDDFGPPSWKVQAAERRRLSWRLIAFGLGAAVILALALLWLFSGGGGPRSVPVVEAESRPVRVRPENRGGMQVPNRDEWIFDQRRGAAPPAPAGLAPAPEAPDLERLRALATPPPAPQPAAPPPAAPPPAPAAPRPAAPAAPPAAAVAPAGAVLVQLGALPTEEAARAEWARLSRLLPDQFRGRTPMVVRFDRPNAAPLWRLRMGGFRDADAARRFCETVRARGGACAVVGG
jgi:cell division septation protein DedD